MHTENNIIDKGQQSNSGFNTSLKREQVIKTIKISEWIENPKGATINVTIKPTIGTTTILTIAP